MLLSFTTPNFDGFMSISVEGILDQLLLFLLKVYKFVFHSQPTWTHRSTEHKRPKGHHRYQQSLGSSHLRSSLGRAVASEASVPGR